MRSLVLVVVIAVSSFSATYPTITPIMPVGVSGVLDTNRTPIKFEWDTATVSIKGEPYTYKNTYYVVYWYDDDGGVLLPESHTDTLWFGYQVGLCHCTVPRDSFICPSYYWDVVCYNEVNETLAVSYPAEFGIVDVSITSVKPMKNSASSAHLIDNSSVDLIGRKVQKAAVMVKSGKVLIGEFH